MRRSIGVICGLLLGLMILTDHAMAGYENPSNDEFYRAAQDARVLISDVRRVYACWHSKLGSGHTYTHRQILRVVVASIQKAYLEGHTGRGESTAEALRLCRTASN